MIDILFENKYVIAAVKPPGILSQGAADGKGDKDMPKLLSEQTGGKVFLINRLDRCTGGIMLFGKDQKSAGAISALISDKEKCIKEYLAVVSGIPEPHFGTMEDLLFKDARAGKSFVVSGERKGAKKAALGYEVIQSREGEHGTLSLVKIRLGTGRTHQIRVQFSSRGMPVAGDGKYGSRERVRGCADSELGVSPKDMIALHSYHTRLDGTNIAKLDVYSYPNTDRYPFSLFADILAKIISPVG